MRKKLILMILIVMFLPLVAGVSSVFAAGEQTIYLPSSDRASFEKVMTALEGTGTDSKLTLEMKANIDDTSVPDKKFLKFDTTTGAVTVNITAFNNATEKSRKQVLGDLIKELHNSSVSEQSQQKLIDEMSASNGDVSRLLIPLVMDSTSADLFTAMKWINPILPIVRVIFGLGAIITAIVTIASTIMDLIFIGLPVGREFLENRQDQNGGKKPPFVSADAVSVIRETESALDSSGGYKNAYVMYFKRRILTYIVLAICLLYLVVGELGGLIAWLLNLGSGVVN